MKLMKKQIRDPGIFIAVYFSFGMILYAYGLRDGTFYIFDIIGGVIVYKLFSVGKG